MTGYAQCADCSELIPAAAPRCPVCMRERTRGEIFAAVSGKDAKKTAARGNAVSAFFWLLLAAATVYGGMRYQEQAKEKAAEAARIEAEARAAEMKVLREAQENSDPAASAVLPPEESRVGVMAVSDGAPARPAAASAGAGRTSSAQTPTAPDWTVSGEVYDLVSLRPVQGLRLIFTAKSGEGRILGKTDAKGRYRVLLPKKGNAYDLSLKHARYDGLYVEESGVLFKNQSRSRRLDHYRSFRQSGILHVPLSPLPSEDALEHSFVMLPNVLK